MNTWRSQERSANPLGATWIAEDRAYNFAVHSLNRLVFGASSDGAYNQNFNYDSFGNMLLQDNLNTALNGGYSVDPATNRLLLNGTDLQYDASGKLVQSPYHSFLYYPDGNLRCIDSCATGSYLTNASGERVFSQNANRSKLTMYFQGQALAEYNQNTDTWSDYVMVNGQRIAKVDDHQNTDVTHYYLDDHLGTAQLEMDGSGNVTARLAFTPFGQEVVNGTTTNIIGSQPADGTSMHYKFTGKERDAESGLDYFGARYYGSSMGRFMSPDPSGLYFADPTNPQSLNLYSYVLNNPLINVDPTGLDCVYFNDAGNGIEEADRHSNSGECGDHGGDWVNGTVRSAQYFGDTDTWGFRSNDDSAKYLTYANAPGQGAGGNGADCTGNCTVGYNETGLDGPLDVPLNPYALGVIKGVAQRTAWFPAICNVGITARGALPGSRFSYGGDLNSKSGLNSAQGARLINVGKVQASLSVKGGVPSVTAQAPIPGTPFVGGISSKDGTGVSSVSVGMRAGPINVQEYAGVGTEGTCR